MGNPPTQEPVAVLSLCSGGAGLDYGFTAAVSGARVVCWVEWEGFAVSELVRRVEADELDPAPVWTDLRTFDGRPWRGAVDVVVAGYPCQPFSTAGRRGGHADPRHLWPHVARVVGQVRPPVVFVENVPGHVTLGFREVAEHLESLGYEVAAGLFSAAEVGASHRRERLFVLGVGLADPDGAGPQGGGPAVAQRRGESGPLRGDGGADALLHFPPGPGDRDAWAAILKAHPYLAPATQPGVCELVDGLAPDCRGYLRVLGNGVVPLQAGFAFAVTWAALRRR